MPISSNNNTYYNQLLFETGQFPFGQHKLVVTYFGNSTSAPLALNYFVQQDASSKSSNNTTSNSSPSSSTTIDRRAIICGVVGGLVLILLLLVLFFFIRRCNKRREQALGEKSDSLAVVDPFIVPSSNPTSTFLPQNYISNGQSLPSQSISSKLFQRDQPSDPSSRSTSDRIPPLTPLRSQFSSPGLISPSSSRIPLTGSQTDHSIATRVPQAEKEPSMQGSSSPRGDNARFLLHEDSGVRIPPAENDVVELPPFYTPG